MARGEALLASVAMRNIARLIIDYTKSGLIVMLSIVWLGGPKMAERGGRESQGGDGASVEGPGEDQETFEVRGDTSARHSEDAEAERERSNNVAKQRHRPGPRESLGLTSFPERILYIYSISRPPTRHQAATSFFPSFHVLFLLRFSTRIILRYSARSRRSRS